MDVKILCFSELTFNAEIDMLRKLLHYHNINVTEFVKCTLI